MSDEITNSNIHDECKQQLKIMSYITDKKDGEIKDLQIALKGHEKIIMDYPVLKKKLEKIEHYWKDTPIMITFEEFYDEVKLILENKK